MKTGSTLLFLSLTLTMESTASASELVTELQSASPNSALHAGIMELLKQDAVKIPMKPKEASAPFLNPDAPVNSQPVAEGVLELDPVVVTQKKPGELPLRPKLTLDNFFYGDGTIWESPDKRFSISAGRDALIKFNWKF